MNPAWAAVLVTDLVCAAAAVGWLVILWRKRRNVAAVWRTHRAAVRRVARLRSIVGPGVPVRLLPSTTTLVVFSVLLALLVAVSVWTLGYCTVEAVRLLSGGDPL